MSEVPLIHTSLGNVPVDSLRYEHEWKDGPEMTIFYERWFSADGALVKNNTHVYGRKEMVIGATQATM